MPQLSYSLLASICYPSPPHRRTQGPLLRRRHFSHKSHDPDSTADAFPFQVASPADCNFCGGKPRTVFWYYKWHDFPSNTATRVSCLRAKHNTSYRKLVSFHHGLHRVAGFITDGNNVVKYNAVLNRYFQWSNEHICLAAANYRLKFCKHGTIPLKFDIYFIYSTPYV